MNSNKCYQCGLVNFSTETNCKRCQSDLTQPPVQQFSINNRTTACPSCGFQNISHNHCVSCGFNFQQSQPVSVNFSCPFCKSSAGYYIQNKISTGGWVIFILLFLFLCWPLCWIGLLIKDQQRMCRTCHIKLA